MALTATEDSRIPRSGSALEVAEYFAQIGRAHV